MPPAAPSDLFVYLERLGIVTRTVAHAPVFTVAESRVIKAAIPGGHSKNLFLKDRKERLFLVIARDEARIDLKRLPEAIGASGRLSFGSADLLRSVLGVEPGSVTLFAAINDRDGRVSVILDAGLMALESQGLHVTIEGEEPPESEDVDGEGFLLELLGNDHPGIVAEVSAVLAEHGVSIEELHTEVRDAPMAGGHLFEARAILVAPPSGTDALRAALEALADELMVDLTLSG